MCTNSSSSSSQQLREKERTLHGVPFIHFGKKGNHLYDCTGLRRAEARSGSSSGRQDREELHSLCACGVQEQQERPGRFFRLCKSVQVALVENGARGGAASSRKVLEGVCVCVPILHHKNWRKSKPWTQGQQQEGKATAAAEPWKTKSSGHPLSM